MQRGFKIDVSVNYDDDTIQEIEVETFIVNNDRGDILSITDNVYTPAQGDRFYFLPGVSIPRVKLKDLSSQYGIKSTRNLEDATHIFASKHTVNKVSESVWTYKIPTASIEKLYKCIKEDPDVDDYYCEKLETALLVNECDHVYLNYGSAGIFRNCEGEIFEEIRNVEGNNTLLKSSNYIYTINDEFVSEILEINTLSLPILNESELLIHINGEDATVIDEEIFGQLTNMFESSDTDNTVLAMEIMANCNYVDSLLYLELLFKEYAYNMERSRTRNHVNFKGLLAFLNKSKNDMTTSIDHIMNSLKGYGVLTIDKINYILDKYSDEIHRHGSTSIFKVKSITLDKEYLEDLNFNFNYKVETDFFPVELEEEVVDNIPNEDISKDDSSNEDTTDVLKVNEDTVEEIDDINTPVESLEINPNENDGDKFEWF